MKLNTVIIAVVIAAAVIALLTTASCQKEKVQITAKPAPDLNANTKTIAASFPNAWYKGRRYYFEVYKQG